MKHVIVLWALFVLLGLSCNNIIEIVPVGTPLPTEIQDPNGSSDEIAENPQAAPTATFTPVPTPTPTPTPTVTPYFLSFFSQTTPCENRCLAGCQAEGTPAEQCQQQCWQVCPNDPPRHGLIIAFLLPVLMLGIPWIIAESFVVKVVQPKSIDLSEVLVKAQDGLFIYAVVSMTARRTVSLAAAQMTWGRVREFVEKSVEQELLHQAISYPTLEDLEKNIKDIANSFMNLPVIEELSQDFGVEVMRFNIETRFPQETMDALNRKAEASADGTAYLAYAAAAHLDPDSKESRELYRVYQETKGRVDAARNLGGGLSNLASSFHPRHEPEESNDDTDF